MGEDEKQADADSDRFEDDHPGEGVARLGSSFAPASQRQQGERDRHQADPDPLATPQLEAEEALGEHRQEDEASGEHRLADRDRGKRERGHVQRERYRRHAPADAPPLGPKEIDCAAQGMPHVDIGRSDAPCLNRKARFVPARTAAHRTGPRRQPTRRWSPQRPQSFQRAQKRRRRMCGRPISIKVRRLLRQVASRLLGPPEHHFLCAAPADPGRTQRKGPLPKSDIARACSYRGRPTANASRDSGSARQRVGLSVLHPSGPSCALGRPLTPLARDVARVVAV